MTSEGGDQRIRDVYAGEMDDDDPRDVFPVRLRRSSIAKLNAIAAAHEGWTPSEALRHLLALGLAAYEDPTPRRIRPAPTSAHGPAVIDAATHAKLQKKGKQ